MERIARIRAALAKELAAKHVEVIDDSAAHRGHAGARDGRGHFRVHVVADCFRGLSPLARHRMVYAALGELMVTDIHAVSIRAEPPEE